MAKMASLTFRVGNRTITTRPGLVIEGIPAQPTPPREVHDMARMKTTIFQPNDTELAEIIAAAHAAEPEDVWGYVYGLLGVSDDTIPIELASRVSALLYAAHLI